MTNVAYRDKIGFVFVQAIVGKSESYRENIFNFFHCRVNQHPGLVAIHTMWVRQHNRIALGLRQVNPRWDEERLFQETRRIIGAQMQMITYNEFLPLVIGNDRMQFYKLNVLDSGYSSYDPQTEPTILSEFSSAAFRFGHSLINGLFTRVGTTGSVVTYSLRENFFIPFGLYNGEMDSILRGILGRNAQRSDPFVHTDVRNHLYKARGDSFGSDLPAFNVQRGRDHGLPGYTKYLKYCFNEVRT